MSEKVLPPTPEPMRKILALIDRGLSQKNIRDDNCEISVVEIAAPLDRGLPQKPLETGPLRKSVGGNYSPD